MITADEKLGRSQSFDVTKEGMLATTEFFHRNPTQLLFQTNFLGHGLGMGYHGFTGSKIHSRTRGKLVTHRQAFRMKAQTLTGHRQISVVLVAFFWNGQKWAEVLIDPSSHATIPSLSFTWPYDHVTILVKAKGEPVLYSFCFLYFDNYKLRG